MSRVRKAGAHKAGRLWCAALALGLTVGCGPEDSNAGRDVAEVGKSAVKFSKTDGSGSVFGSYLAGRFAESQSDLAFAANMLERVLEENPEDRKLLRRTFVLQLGAGNTKRAVELAERLVDTGGGLTSSTLILAARDLRAGKSADALAQLDNLSSGGLGRFAKPLARAWVLTEQKKYDAALEALNPLAKEKGFDAMHG
ncbi:MAG: tetratricopeptide repeat protein, partial [Alphaproteobacteria bacterium]|nr:tetratricopeptide repeat protein [Alphaproteobacteria bacterium]